MTNKFVAFVIFSAFMGVTAPLAQASDNENPKKTISNVTSKAPKIESPDVYYQMLECLDPNDPKTIKLRKEGKVVEQ